MRPSSCRAWSTSATLRAPLSGMSQQKVLMLAMTEELVHASPPPPPSLPPPFSALSLSRSLAHPSPTFLRMHMQAACRRAAVHEDGALDDVSTLVPPVRGFRFAKSLPADATDLGGFDVGPPNGMRAHSLELYGQQWAEEGSKLRRTTLTPGVPLPEDSLSAMGAAAVALQLALEHGMRHPGFYNRLGADGDGDRAFYQGDGSCYPLERAHSLDPAHDRQRDLTAGTSP